MKNLRNAFSLVEMLVAVVLISLLIGIAIFSLRYQFITVKKTKEVGINEVLHFNQLRDSLSSMKYYVVDDYDILGQAMKNLHFYFDGTKDEINYITTNPLFSDDVAVVKLTCENQKLIYKEEPLYGNIDFLRPRVLENSREIPLYKDLKKCSFKYLYKTKYIIDLHNDIPDLVLINIASKDKNSNFYIKVKSDYNTSKEMINYEIYSEDY